MTSNGGSVTVQIRLKKQHQHPGIPVRLLKRVAEMAKKQGMYPSVYWREPRP